MWKCPKCETVNNNDFCIICGEKRPESQPAQQIPQPDFVAPAKAKPAKQMTPQKNNGLAITIVVCVTLIVALLLGLGAYILIQNRTDAEVEDKDRGTKSVTTPAPTQAVAVAPTAEPIPALESAVPTPTPTPTPTANTNAGAATRENFLKRAAEIERYADEAGANAMTQSEINQVANEVYQRWDTLLNDVYQYLKTTLPQGEFDVLRKAEIAWIKEKEAAMESQAAEWKGGSGEPMAYYSAGSEYTSKRCYELIAMIH